MPPSTASRRPSRGAIAAILLVIALLAIAAMVRLLSNGGHLFTEATPRCRVTDGTYNLTPEQASNASVISAVALQRDLPERAVTIALATALQESKLKNLDYGDRDSVGLFQQRESQGWGAKDDLQNPIYSAGKFYDELVNVTDWQTRPLTDVAQAVQRSAYPDAYAKWEATAKGLADALYGAAPATLTCTYGAAEPGLYDLPGTAAPGTLTPATVTAALTNELPAREVTTTDSSALSVSAPDPTAGWQTASWLVANGQRFGVESVSFNGKTWHKNDLEWKSDAAVGASQVSATLGAS